MSMEIKYFVHGSTQSLTYALEMMRDCRLVLWNRSLSAHICKNIRI